MGGETILLVEKIKEWKKTINRRSRQTYSPLIINRRCICLHLLPIAFFLIIQASLIEKIINNSIGLVVVFVINILLIIIAFRRLAVRVFNIKKNLKGDILRHATMLSELDSQDPNDDPDQWLSALKEKLPKDNIHYKFLLRYLYCFISVIFGFAALYTLLFIYDPQSFPALISYGRMHRFFDFLYLSFSTITISNFGDIVPATIIAKIATMAEVFFSILFFVIIFEIYFSQKEDLNTVISSAIVDVVSKLKEIEDKSGKKASRLKASRKKIAGRDWQDG